MKKNFFFSVLASGMFISSTAQIELPVRTMVIVVDKTKNTVYVRKIDAGNMYSFSVKQEDVKKFQPGIVAGIRFEAKTVDIPPVSTVKILNPQMSIINANNFSMKVVSIDALANIKDKNKVPPKIWRMPTVINRNDENSILIRACCEENTTNGYEFMIPAGMKNKDLERTVYVYKDLVFTDQQKANGQVLIFPVSGHWNDTSRIVDDTPSSKSDWEGPNKNIAVRPNTSEQDKWVITPVTDMKGVQGRLDMNFPDSVVWDIGIYQQADNKMVNSFENRVNNSKSYDLSAGEYRILLTNVPVENVPIQTGNVTRLKAGFLHVVSKGNWFLHDVSKKKLYTSNSKPQLIALPVGKYQLELGKKYYPIVIKDGETVEDYTPVKIKEAVIPISNAISAEVLTIDAEQYTMTRVPTGGEDTVMQTKGRLATKFPLATTDAFLPSTWRLAICRAGEPEASNIIHCMYSGNDVTGIPCHPSYILDEGVYDVYFSGLKVQNVAIRKGYETTMKVGYLVHGANGLYQIYGYAQSGYMKYSSQGPARHALPIGNYRVKLFFVGGEYPVQIKEGEVSVVKPPDIGLKPKSRTITSSIKPNSIYGRLNTSFPEDTSLRMSVRVPNPNSNSGSTSIKLDSVKFYDLLPGNYTVYLNYMPVDVSIQKGQETKIRFGYLNMQNGGSWIITTGGLQYAYQSDKKGKIALPIGYYSMRISASSYLFKIKEGETNLFLINYSSSQ